MTKLCGYIGLQSGLRIFKFNEQATPINTIDYIVTFPSISAARHKISCALIKQIKSFPETAFVEQSSF